jgi:hypothetical protein
VWTAASRALPTQRLHLTHSLGTDVRLTAGLTALLCCEVDEHVCLASVVKPWRACRATKQCGRDRRHTHARHAPMHEQQQQAPLKLRGSSCVPALCVCACEDRAVPHGAAIRTRAGGAAVLTLRAATRQWHSYAAAAFPRRHVCGGALPSSPPSSAAGCLDTPDCLSQPNGGCQQVWPLAPARAVVTPPAR